MARSTLRGKILDYIKQYRDGHGYPPSVRDIQEGLGISTTSVVGYHLRVLEKQGYVERTPSIDRGVRLTPKAMAHLGSDGPYVSIPLMGRISASEPVPLLGDEISVFEGEHIMLPTGMVAENREIYALRVQGDSMVDALVADGDMVILERCSDVQDGAMAVVWLKREQKTALRWIYRGGEQVFLRAAYPSLLLS